MQHNLDRVCFQSVNFTNLTMEGYIPRSCLDYLKQSIPPNGFYLLYDDNNQLYTVFCDFSTEPGSAWTLVMSWVSAKYKDLSYFQNRAFYEDAPINEETPNTDIYRQTLARMNSIRVHSTHWRATCNVRAQTYRPTIDYQDYLRGKFSDFDIINFDGGSVCQPVEYINILGAVGGSGTTVGFWQSSGNYMLHIDSSDSGCEFVPLTDPRVDYFGYYGDGLSSEFSCSLYDSATTQWWFGGYVQEN